MKILVTGANGFLGSNLVRALLDQRHSVRGLVRPTADLRFLAGLPLDCRMGDVTDPESVRRAMDGVEVVFNLASLVSDWGPLSRFRRVNVDGTRNVVDAAGRAGVGKVVHVSSVVVMGLGRVNVSEDLDTASLPLRFPYSVTKLEAETQARTIAAEHGLPLTIIRPGGIYGPNDRTWMLVMLDKLERGQFAYVGGGRSEVATVYVGNVVQALLLAADRRRGTGETFSITDGVHITWKTLIGKLAALLGVAEPWLNVPFPLAYATAACLEAGYKVLRRAHAPLVTKYRVSVAGIDFHFSIDKARRLLSYEPDQNVDRHLGETVDWYRAFTRGRPWTSTAVLRLPPVCREPPSRDLPHLN